MGEVVPDGVPVSVGVVSESLDAWAALLREQAPSAETAASLDDMKGEWLSPRGRVDALAVVERHLSWLQAKQVELLAVISEHTEGPPQADVPAADLDAVFLGEWDCAVEEVACALKLANSTAAQRLETARLLTGRHPATLGLLADGEISYQQARVVAEQCAVLAVDVAGEVERALVERMPQQAAGQTRAAVRRQVHLVDPEGAEARHQERVRERKLLSYPQEDGMTLFGAVLPAQRAAVMEQVVEAYAVGYGDDGRTLDQKRADALYDLVVEPRAGAALEVPSRAVTAVVHVTVPLDVLMGVDDGPGELKGVRARHRRAGSGDCLRRRDRMAAASCSACEWAAREDRSPYLQTDRGDCAACGCSGSVLCVSQLSDACPAVRSRSCAAF
ncbi:DUF222 domain-containing protein [Streptomyces sp. GLT-R25]